MSAESENLIELRSLCLVLGGKTLLQPLSLSVARGESFAVVGHNGAGKTTLFHLLFGLKFPTSGSVWIQGVPTEKPEARKGVGYVPERPYLHPESKFGGFLKLHAELIGLPKSLIKTEIERVAHEVGLQGHLGGRFKTFSKGMLQKAVLAQASLGDPSLIILDEPMSGLDPEAREGVRKRLVDWKHEGRTLVFSSHAFEDVEAVADRVIVLKNGTLDFLGSVQEWRENR